MNLTVLDHLHLAMLAARAIEDQPEKIALTVERIKRIQKLLDRAIKEINEQHNANLGAVEKA